MPTALGRLRVALETAYARASREHGLTAQQAELLCAAMRPASVGDLAEALRCDRSNVSRLVDRASRRGLIERSAALGDARVSLIRLTSEGHERARLFIQTLEAQLGPMLERWAPEREQTAVDLMNEVADSLEADQPSELRRRPAPRSRAAQDSAGAAGRRGPVSPSAGPASSRSPSPGPG